MSSSDQDLAAVVKRYGQVAATVNQREAKRFITDIRQRWKPEQEPEPDIRGEGYTSEGALTACVYNAAFINWKRTYELAGGDDRPDSELCEAEWMRQIQLRPMLEEFVDWMPEPLRDPLPHDDRIGRLHFLRTQLQEQIDASGVVLASPLELPYDISELYAITNGVRGAGVESETDGTSPIWGMPSGSGWGGIKSERGKMPLQVTLNAPDELSRFGEKATAAWKLGGDCQQRSLFYVLCRSTETGATTWRIFDVLDVEINLYDSIAQLLQHETESIEKHEGGAQTQHVIMYESYPLFDSY